MAERQPEKPVKIKNRRTLRYAGYSLILFSAVIWILTAVGFLDEHSAFAVEGFAVLAHGVTVAFELVSEWIARSAAVQVPSSTDHGGRTRPRPFVRFVLILMGVVFGSLAVALFLLPFLPLWLGAIVGRALFISSPTIGHLVGFGIFAYVALLLAIFMTKNNAKHKKLLRVERSTDALGRLEPIPTVSLSAEDKERRRSDIDQVLHDLLASTDQAFGIIRPLTGRSIRSAWVLVPDETGGEFKTIHMVSTASDADYSGVRLNHKPKLWNRGAFRKIAEDWNAKLGELDDLKWRARRRRKKEMKNELRACGSLTGFVFEQDKARVYGNVANCEVFDSSYVDHISEELRKELKFRSAAGIALRVGGKPVAVLMLYGTVISAFGERDQTTLRIWAHMLSPHIGANVGLGVYTG